MLLSNSVHRALQESFSTDLPPVEEDEEEFGDGPSNSSGGTAWVGGGSPTLPDTGRLVVVKRDGSLMPVVDRRGRERVLDRPTSMEFFGNTAYVVSVDGNVYRIRNLYGRLAARRQSR